jgi:hypothetical protein
VLALGFSHDCRSGTLPPAARQLCYSSATLAGLAFVTTWVMTSRFDDDFAKLIFTTALASWKAVSSGITGLLLLQMDGPRASD